MIASVSGLWRYPIKGIGAERLETVDLETGKPFPMDRAWAVLEEGRSGGTGWLPCQNFLRGAKGPSLMAVTAKSDGSQLRLGHPERPDLVFEPGSDDPQTLFDWLAPIYPEDRAKPTALLRAPEQGMSDADFASVSILSTSSLKALSQKAGHDMDTRRFRANVWLEGLAPWEEFDLVGKSLAIGSSVLEVVEPITRCRATEANPKSGRRDIPTLRLLEDGWGHTDFGVYARVISGGIVSLDDPVAVI